MSINQAMEGLAAAAPERAARRGVIRGTVAGLAGLALVAAGVLLTQRAAGEPFAMIVVGLLAGMGVVALVGVAAGLLVPAAPKRANFSDVLVAETATGFAVADAGGGLLTHNAAYADLLACAGSPLTPEKALAGHPEAAEALYRLAESARRREAWREDVRVIAPTKGEPRWLRIAVRPADAEGAPVTLWRVADISGDSERQEDTFRELQQIINYLDHAPVGFFSARADGRIAYLNATLAGWLGLDLDKTTGGALALGDIVAGPAAALITQVHKARTGTRIERFDVDFKRASGQSLPVRIIHRVGFDERGQPLPSRSVVLNRGPGEEVSEGLRAAEVRFSRFFNNAPIGIAMLDSGGVIDRVNPAFARIFAGRADRGAALADLVGADSRLPLAGLIARARSGASETAPLDVGFAEGRNGQIFLSRIEDARDGSTGLLAYAIDITEQRSLEAQFAQSQKMQAIGQLAGGIAHDFNNVLTAIIGFSDLLLANSRPTDPSFADIMNIKQNANRAAGLVRQLLAFSRRQTMRPEVLSLTDVLSDLTVLLDRLVGETVELDVVHGRDLWLIKADLNQFEQVIVNLVVNARDAMPEGGTVTIRTANVSAAEAEAAGEGVMPAADHVLIEVADTGTGIAKENLAKIFEPFFSTKEVGKGTGLGLSTVYGIVKQTGGYVFADSREGEGATFRVFLPRHVPAAGAAPAAREVKADPAKADLTGKGTILLVEDEDAVRAFASRALASKGYTVLTAESGAAALKIAEDHDGEIDLVVSDVVMPEMDGPTLLKALRRRYPDLRIIFISGYAEDAFQNSLDPETAFTFLPKPFSLKQLALAVKEVLEKD